MQCVMASDYPYTWAALRGRYNMKRKRLDGVMSAKLIDGPSGQPESVLDRLRRLGLKRGQRYFTGKMWQCIITVLDPILLDDGE